MCVRVCSSADMNFVPGLTFASVCYFNSKTNIVPVDRAKSFVDSSKRIPFVSRSKYANAVCIYLHLAACLPFYFFGFYQISNLEFLKVCHCNAEAAASGAIGCIPSGN